MFLIEFFLSLHFVSPKRATKVQNVLHKGTAFVKVSPPDLRESSSFLQAQSYPVVNPDGAEFPSGMWINRSHVYEVHLRSDLKPALLSVPFPVAGDWFMVAFINDTSNRITQAVSFRGSFIYIYLVTFYLFIYYS